jgi:hypothetical protein
MVGSAEHALAAEDDDRRRDHGRPSSNHVEHGHRIGVDAAHRCTDDRRNGVIDGPRWSLFQPFIPYSKDWLSAECCDGRRIPTATPP